MNLTRATPYAVHALVFLASRPAGQPVPADTLARSCAIPRQFLMKMLRELVRFGFLGAVKGPRGGYWLARPAQRLSLLNVPAALEGPVRGQASFALPGKATRLSRHLDAVFDRAAGVVRRQLRRVRIADPAKVTAKR
jgi:Rrf2 family protein